MLSDGLLSPDSLTPDFAGLLDPCQAKLATIACEMHLCKTALSLWKLDQGQSLMAHRLVVALERGVDELGAIITERLLQGDQNRNAPLSQIEQHLDELGAICKRLISTVFANIALADCSAIQ